MESPMANPLESDMLRIASELEVGDPTRRKILGALKEAGESQHFWKIVDKRGYHGLRKALGTDKQSVGLLSESLLTLMRKMELTSNEGAALNRLLTGIDRASSWDEATHRNNIFKAANLLGIKLPSAMF